jgi:hypothetical protein
MTVRRKYWMPMFTMWIDMRFTILVIHSQNGGERRVNKK